MVGALSAGCYTLEPAGGVTPEVGTGVAFDINDVGRVALGGSMGPEIDQVEGRLLSKDGADYMIGVTAVHLLRGGTQVWHGEAVRISPNYVNTMYLRRFSAGKTIAISAVGIAAVAAMAGTVLATTGAPDTEQKPETTGVTRRVPVARRPPLRIKFQFFPPTP